MTFNTYNMNTDTNIWQPDILGDGFEMTYMPQPDDYSGHVRSTLVRLRAHDDTQKAVLYVHGFSDYFLQDEMARMFAGAGYSFYAVDLRKYGRSLLPGQRMFQVRDLHEYFADINSAIDIMQTDGIREIILLGHSTGGLTTSLYMSEHPSPLIKALILNSPFLAWNLPPLLRNVAMPVVSALGRIMPDVRVHQKPDSGYAETLAAEHGGEWHYRRDWKPDILPDPDMGWVRAIHTAQQRLRHGHIRVPVLLMHSAESVHKGDPKAKYYHADAILDVNAISRYGRRLADSVTEVAFAGGLHDLVLSRKNIREKVYKTMLEWLRQQNL
ncbi:MAG: alpha/beta hydrolase [Muribaculaceae bacterium]|nr:alpha/beta hydrolase [Muribaculaceae bacterium]